MLNSLKQFFLGNVLIGNERATLTYINANLPLVLNVVFTNLF